MEVNNKLYQNIGIHIITSMFTVENGNVKVLLVKRTNEPFNGYWALPGGALYNNELLEDGAKRELVSKTGIKNIDLDMVGLFDRVDRSNLMRMVGISYLGVIDNKRVQIEKITEKTSNADFFKINEIPDLAYDHNEIIKKSLEALKTKIINSTILKSLFPEDFTLPEIQKAYEAILDKKFDRRNFRKKLLSLNIIEDINQTRKFEGKKPAKLYRFKKKIENKNVF